MQNRFPQFIRALDQAAAAGHPASYHIGVIATDLPNGVSPPVCYGPTGGKLFPGPSQSPSSAVKPPADCTNFVLTDGAPFIEYDQVSGTSNVGGINAPDVGDDVASAFTCTSSVGDQGCGVVQALESAYETLHDGLPENAGFLRDDALLAVVFLADKDECSLPPDSDLFDPSADGVAKYGLLSSFRCVQFGTSCTTPPMPLDVSVAAGPFDDCAPLAQADGGKLVDVERYIDHSCMAPSNPAFFGDPTVRLSAVVDAALTSQRTSICDTDFSDGFASLARSIVARLK